MPHSRYRDVEARRRYMREFYRQPAQKEKRRKYDRERMARLTRERFAVFIAKFNGQCVYCLRTIAEHDIRLTRDHKVPLARGGTDDDDNIVAACFDCNRRKGTKSYEQFMAIMQPNRIPDWVTEEFVTS